MLMTDEDRKRLEEMAARARAMRDHDRQMRRSAAQLRARIRQGSKGFLADRTLRAARAFSVVVGIICQN